MKMDLGDFQKVSLDDISIFKEYYRKFPPQHSDYLHAIMYSWRDYMTYSFTLLDDHLIILGVHEGEHYIRPPIGPPSIEVFQEVLDLSEREGWDPKISMMGEQTKEWMKESFSDLKYEPDRDYFDYIYLTSDLSDLPGKSYLKVRNYLNKFRKTNEHSVEPISTSNLNEAKDFLIKWCEQKGCQDDPFLMQERQATFHALDDIFELGMEGLVIRVDGEVQAFSIFEQMREDMAVIHYEKANSEIVGLYQAINNEAARFLSGRYRYLDRESDMGVPGLRRAKEKYRPHHMLEIHHAR